MEDRQFSEHELRERFEAWFREAASRPRKAAAPYEAMTRLVEYLWRFPGESAKALPALRGAAASICGGHTADHYTRAVENFIDAVQGVPAEVFLDMMQSFAA